MYVFIREFRRLHPSRSHLLSKKHDLLQPRFIPFRFTVLCCVLFLVWLVGNREKLLTKTHVLPCENVEGTLEPWCKTIKNSWDTKKQVQLKPFLFGSCVLKRCLLGANDTFKYALQWLEPTRLGLTRSNTNVLLLCDICAFPRSLLELLKAQAPIWKWNKQHKSDCGWTVFRSRASCQK